MNKTKLNQLGDTIVEVLVAVTVVGLAIGLAYGIANRSLKASRQAQERGEAVKVVEGQLESIKSIASSEDQQGLFSTDVFCIDPAGSNAGNVTTAFQAGFVYTDDLQNDPLDKYGDCVSSNNRYHIAIKRQANTFTVNVRWFGVGNLTKEEIKTNYRIYK